MSVDHVLGTGARESGGDIKMDKKTICWGEAEYGPLIVVTVIMIVWRKYFDTVVTVCLVARNRSHVKLAQIN